MEINKAEAGSVVVLRLDGDIDAEGVNKLRVALLHCLKEQRHNVVINMHGVGLVSYMGLGVLVERLRQFRVLGGDLKLVGINVATERLFRMAGVGALFEVYESENQATQVFADAA